MYKRKRVLAWMLMVVLCIQAIVPASLVKAAEGTAAGSQQEVETATVIDVTDYGADPSGKNDSVIPIRKAIEAAKQTEGPVVLNFPKGEYNLWPDDATVRRIYISNSTTPSESAYEENSIRTIGILLEGMKDVTVEGNGSKLIYHGKMMSFAVIGCENVKIQNLSYDFATHYVVDITVEAVTENTADVYIPDSYDYEINGTNITFYGEVSPKTGDRYWSRPDYPYGQIHEMLTGEIYRTGGAGALFNNCTSIEDIGNRRVRFHYSQKPQAKVGYNMQVKETIRDNPSLLLWESENVALTNITAGHLHSFGIVGQFSKNITIDNLSVIADERKGVLTAAGADSIQMSGCGGKITIKNSRFTNPQDDPINIHGTFLQIAEVLASNKITVEYKERETYGFPNYYVGDEVEFISRLNLNSVGTADNRNAIVTEVENPAADDYTKENRKRITLTFDRDIPDEILNGTVSNYVVENITYTPEVEITNCEFNQSPVRGILCTTRKKVLIEGCTFKNMNMHCIYISDDANGWYESGYFRDVTIRNNIFEACNAAPISVEPIVYYPDRDHPLHQNLVIEGNTFLLKDTRAIQVKSVENVTVRNNTFRSIDEDVSVSLNVPNSELKKGDFANFSLEVASPAQGTGLFSAEYSKNVTISDNVYGVGLNKKVTTSNMDAAEVTVVNDAALLNADNKQTDYLDGYTVKYYSSDNSVIQIDDQSQIVMTLASGTASLYAVVTTKDGKKWESNRVNFTVEDAEPEKAVTVEAEKNVITEEGGTLALTAKQNGTALKEVSWAVRDVTTGGTSDLAEIDENGTLTARNNGVVDVVATAPDGSTGRKLIHISIERMERTAAIVNEIDGQLTMNDPNTMTQKVSSQWGFFDSRNQQESLITYPIANGADFEATVKLKGTMKNTYEETGFGILKDVDNYVAVQKKNHLGLILVTEANAHGSEDAKLGGVKPEEAYYKITKQGNVFQGFYRLKETDEWTKIGQVTNTSIGNDSLILALWAASANSTANSVVWSDLTINGVKQSFGYANKMPSAQNAVLQADSLQSGNVIRAAYDYSDPNGDPEGNSLVVWYMADEENGTYTRMNGAVAKEITLLKSYEGKYFKAEIIPVDGSGMPGESVMTQAAGPVTAGEDEGGTDDEHDRVSTNAWLSELELTGLHPSPGFSCKTMSYMAGTTAETESIPFKAAVQVENAVMKVTVNGEVLAEGVSAFAREITLLSGFNTVKVDVTAPDGITTRQYKVIIVRNGYTDTALSEIKVNGQPVEGFAPDKKQYEIVLAEPSEVTLEAAAANARSSVLISDGKNTSGNGGLKTQAKAGKNEFTIAVTSESMADTAYYTVKVKVAKADNANLEEAIFDNAVLDDSFSAETTSYHGEAQAQTVAFRLKAEEPGATIEARCNRESFTSENGELEGNFPMYVGENKILVKVIARDGTEKTYTFHIDGKDSVYLSDLRWEQADSGWAGHLVQRDKNILKGILSLRVNGTVTEFEKGIGSHADSTIIYDMKDKGYTRFTSWVGVDAARNGAGSVRFQVLADGVEVYDSGVLTSNSNAGYIDLDITGVNTITLIADKNGNNSSDHANFADAKFMTGMEEKVCTCAIENLQFEGQEIELTDETSKSIALEAGADFVGECLIDGHENAEITYEYQIISDTSGDAEIKDNRLILKHAGDVVVEVTAAVADRDVKARKRAVFSAIKKEGASKVLLRAVHGAYAGMDLSVYTEESAQALRAALDAAETVLDQSNAGDNACIKAAEDVLKAAAGLIFDTSELEAAVGTAQEKAEAAERAAAAATEAAGTAQQAAEAANAAAEQARKESAENKQAAQLAQQAADAARQAADEAQAKADAAEQLAVKANTELQEAQKQVAAQQAALEEARKQAETQQAALDEIKKQAGEQQTALEEARKQAAAQQTTLDELKKQAEAQQAALEESGKQVVAQQAALDEIKKQTAAQQAALEEAKKQMAEQQAALEEAKKQAEAQQAALEEAKKQAEAQQAALEEARKQAEAQQAALEETKKQAEAASLAAQKAQQQAEAAEREAREAKAALDAQKQQETPKPGDPAQTVQEGQIYNSGDYYYKVTSVSKQTAEVTGIKNDALTKINVPDTAAIGGKSYKVTSVAASAFKGNKKVTGAVIGKYVKSIGNNAFSGCKKLKKVTLKSTKLTRIGSKAFFGCKKLKNITIKSKALKKVGKNAFKGIYKKAVIKVPKAKKKAYAKLLAKKGQSGTVRIK